MLINFLKSIKLSTKYHKNIKTLYPVNSLTKNKRLQFSSTNNFNMQNL